MADAESKQGSKEISISILTQRWPLSAKQIYKLLKKELPITYQAVHKSLHELVDSKIVIKKAKEYCLNPDYITKMRKHWTAVEEKYKEHPDSKVGLIFGKRIVTPTAIYSFEQEHLIVGFIPSVFISKSTLQEFVESASKSTLERIAKKIAEKDYKYILGHMIEKSELGQNPLSMLNKLNELANDYYWGKVSYKKQGDAVEIKINSNLYVTNKGKHFYDKIYEYFMNILGYKLIKRNTLETTYTYKEVVKK